jgi:hypothetical protein
MICCYNAARNDPYKEAHHPRYTPLSKVEDAQIRQVGRERAGSEGLAWLDPGADVSAKSLGDREPT